MSMGAKDYLVSMRPETWPLAAVPTLLSGFMAADISLESILIVVQIAIIMCVMILGGINMYNEVYDIKHDKINKPKRPIVSGRLMPNNARNASLALFAISIAWSYLLSPWIFVLSSILVLLGIMYSIPGIRTKDDPVTSMATLGLGYGIIMPIAPWLLLAGSDLIAGVAIASIGFVWFSGTTNFKDFRDVPGDVKAGTNTFAATRGERWTLKVMLLFMFFVPAALLIVYAFIGLLPIGSLAAFIPLAITMVIIADLYRKYSPERAFRGYKITYLVFPLIYLMLYIGFIGG